MNIQATLQSRFNCTLFPWVLDTNKTLFFGGNQMWFKRRTATSAGCGPVAATNAFFCLAKKHKIIARRLDFAFLPDGTIDKEHYTSMMEHIYKCMGTLEIPILSTWYDHLKEGKRLPLNLPASMGMSIMGYIQKSLIYAMDRHVFLHSHTFPTPFCNYKKALHFIEQGLEKSGSIALLTTLNTHHERIYSRKNGFLDTPVDTKIRRHFVSIAGIRTLENGKKELLISTWGHIGRVDFDTLYKSWQSPLAMNTAMVYFTPTPDRKQTHHDICMAPLQLVRSFTRSLFGVLLLH